MHLSLPASEPNPDQRCFEVLAIECNNKISGPAVTNVCCMLCWLYISEDVFCAALCCSVVSD